MENQAKALQQPAINVTLQHSVSALSEAELITGFNFLQAAGLVPTTLTVQDANSGATMANSSGVVDTLKATGKDIANRMEFGQRLALLESRSAGPCADHHLFDTSTTRAQKMAAQHLHLSNNPSHGLTGYWTRPPITTYSCPGMMNSPGMSP